MYIGIDLGGTNIAVGVVDDNGKILASDSTPTLAERPFSEVVADMAMVSKKVVEDAGLTMDDIKAVGIGSPGTIDTENGVVVYSNNIKMENIPIANELKKYIDKPIDVENDANAAAMGEYMLNGNGAKSYVFITLGTGVGGGVVLDGQLYRGFNFAGGELGHMSIVYNGESCTCGRRGCWEAYASVTALIRQTKAAIEAHPESLMSKLAEEDGKVSGRTSFTAAAEGDKVAQQVVDQYVEYIGEGIASIVNIFQPEKLVIGGGISREGDKIIVPVREYLAKNDYNKFMPRTELGIATLFNDAGIIGAAMSAKARFA